MTVNTAALTEAVKANVRKRASQLAFEWRWDAAHGETMDPAWALRLAAELEAVEVWLAPDGYIKARTATGRYNAYEMLEGAAAELLSAEEFATADLDWRGGDRGVAVFKTA